MYIVAALYQFKTWGNFSDFQKALINLCKNNDIKGTLLLAPEGINGTISGTRQSIDTLYDYFYNELNFKNLEYKESFADQHPFYRLKIRLKKEIVTLRQPQADPNKQVGTYVMAQEWNELISDPNTIVLDTRNDYEYKIGTFKNALNPNTHTFTEFPNYVKENLHSQKQKRIAMFCTGGIRCEKASSYMLSQGFENVYHLKGGILKYLEEIPTEQSLWEGSCFVFDQRVSISHGLEIDDFEICHACRAPLSPQSKQSQEYEAGVSCAACFHITSENDKKRFRERQNQIQLAHERGQIHIGRTKSDASSQA